ncbi:hypothetical protein [Salinispira pacifica]
MYLVGLLPASTESEREIALLKRRLFSACGHPSFLSLPPMSLVTAQEESPDLLLLDRIAISRETVDEPEEEAPYFKVDGKSGEVGLRPPPSGALVRAWTALHAALADSESAGEEAARWPHRPEPWILLGVAGARIAETKAAAPASLTPVREYRIAVVEVRSPRMERYFEAVEWEIIYDRLPGHRRRT